MRLGGIVSLVDAVDNLFHLGGYHIGQKSEPSHVHADDWSLLGSHPAGSLEQRAVAANGYYEVGIEVVAVELGVLSFELWQQLVEEGGVGAVDENL